MNVVVVRLALRSIAVLIGIVAVIDPVWSSSRPSPRELIAISLASSDVRAAIASLNSGLSGWDVVPRETVSTRIPCGPDEQCVVLADGSRDIELPTDLRHPASLVTVRPAGGPNVSLQSVVTGPGHVSAAGAARVELRREGAVDRTRLEIRDGAAVIGTAIHEWKSESATVDVPWWPIEPGARTLRIEAVPVDGERTVIDNAIDVGVTVASAPVAILVYDARPSWSSTFVRRALEDDTRFAVDYRTRLAPALSAGTANGRLDARVLDSAAVVVIGGPDALTASEVTLLEQFVRVRGGTLVLLPEHRETGEASRLFGGAWTEHLASSPERLGPLHATEILRTGVVSMASTVLAHSGSMASIVVAPTGNGRVVMSGAMDAWRYRDLDAGAFDQFWRSLVAEGATAGQALQLRFTQALEARGSRARFTLRDRRMQPSPAVDATAVSRCGTGPARVVRLWPSGTFGEFSGELAVEGTGSCSIEATVGDRQVSGAVAVAERPMRGAEATIASLSRRVAAAGGSIGSADDVSSVVRAIESSPATMSPVVTVHPMRAWWWMVPFAACLSIEWWLRRRGGLR
jgi:hypothetical protein